MSLYFNRIKEVAKQKKIKLKNLAEDIGMTEAGFFQAIKNNSLKLEKFLKICEILEVSPAKLLEDEIKEFREEDPTYGMDEKEMIREVLKTVKSIEKQIIK